MMVLPVGVKPDVGDRPGVDSAALVGPEVPIEVRIPAAHAPGARTVAVFGDSVAWTMMRYLPSTPGFRLHQLHDHRVWHRPRRAVPVRRRDADPEARMRYVAESMVPTHQPRPARCGAADHRPLGDRRSDIEGRWTHIGEPGYDAYLRGELNRALDVLGSTGARIVVTTEPYNRRAEKPDGSLYPEDDPDRVDEWNALVARRRQEAAERFGARPERQTRPERRLHQPGRRRFECAATGCTPRRKR